MVRQARSDAAPGQVSAGRHGNDQCRPCRPASLREDQQRKIWRLSGEHACRCRQGCPPPATDVGGDAGTGSMEASLADADTWCCDDGGGGSPGTQRRFTVSWSVVRGPVLRMGFAGRPLVLLFGELRGRDRDVRRVRRSVRRGRAEGDQQRCGDPARVCFHRAPRLAVLHEPTEARLTRDNPRMGEVRVRQSVEAVLGCNTNSRYFRTYQ